MERIEGPFYYQIYYLQKKITIQSSGGNSFLHQHKSYNRRVQLIITNIINPKNFIISWLSSYLKAYITSVLFKLLEAIHTTISYAYAYTTIRVTIRGPIHYYIYHAQQQFNHLCEQLCPYLWAYTQYSIKKLEPCIQPYAMFVNANFILIMESKKRI